MTAEIFLVLVGVAGAVAAVLWLIHRYPLSLMHRTVLCPARQVPAHVCFIRNESGYGNIAPTDVASCSLLGESVGCDKECLKDAR